MTSKKEFILQTDGCIVRRVVTEEEIEVGENIVDSITQSVARVLTNAFPIADVGPVHLRLTGGQYSYATVPLSYLSLRAPYILSDGALVPNFESLSDAVLPLVWEPFPGMRLYLLVTLSDDEGCLRSPHIHLYAVDDENRFYRLPLSNLFDDCKLCNGEFNSSGTTAMEVVAKCLSQFNASQWRQDGGTWKSPEITYQFFRFKPKNEGFEPLPSKAPWTSLCQKISTPMTENLVL